jgi:hypothetical protein
MVLNSHPIKKIDSRLSIRPETDNAGELKRLMQVNNLNSIYSKYYYSYYSGTCLIRGKYSGTCAIRHLSFPTSCDIRQKFMATKYFC